MRHKTLVRQLLIVITLATFVAGCSGPTRIKSDALPGIPPYNQGTADQLLAKASNAPFPENVVLTLKASSALMESDPPRAKKVLEGVDYGSLPDNLKEKLALQHALIADRTNQSWEVFEWLDREAVINSSDPKTVAQAHALRAKAYNHFGEYQAALDEWLSAMPLLDKKQQASYQKAFWQTLLHVPEPRLNNLIEQTPSNDIKAWLELASLYRPGIPLEQQLSGLQQWLRNWPNHPGSVYLPDNFEKLKASSTVRPEKIAILLPLSGNLAKAGQSIRDGIIAASYEDLQQQAKTPELLLFDTNGKDINQLAEQALQQGAQLIIGPLSKDNVGKIQSDISARVPILALNYLDTPQNSPAIGASELYQFGLSTEDEARMVAIRAKLDGHQRALVLTPSSSWGKKVGQSFYQAWQTNGGQIAAYSEYDKNTEFSKLIGQMLHVDQSHQRARQINRLLKESAGFQARRRQDIDMIFIAANPLEARQIKPALSYQFAGSIPVYATSTVFSGKTNRALDQDIDGTRVPVMPWSIPGTSTELEKKITNAWPHAKGQYGTLFALGADAYKLYPKLQQLANLPGSQVEGLTGWLSINTNKRVDRELTWQIFKNGQLVPLPAKQKKEQAHGMATAQTPS